MGESMHTLFRCSRELMSFDRADETDDEEALFEQDYFPESCTIECLLQIFDAKLIISMHSEVHR